MHRTSSSDVLRRLCRVLILCLGRELAGDRISRWQSIEDEFLVLLAVCLDPFARLCPKNGILVTRPDQEFDSKSMTEASDKSILSSQRDNAGVDDGLRAIALGVIAMCTRGVAVALGDRQLKVIAIRATAGKEKGSCKVGVAQA